MRAVPRALGARARTIGLLAAIALVAATALATAWPPDPVPPGVLWVEFGADGRVVSGYPCAAPRERALRDWVCLDGQESSAPSRLRYVALEPEGAFAFLRPWRGTCGPATVPGSATWYVRTGVERRSWGRRWIRFERETTAPSDAAE